MGTSNLCCESTGRHATKHGYQATFLSDAIGAESLPAYEASIHIDYPLIANAVMEVDEFLAALSTSAESPRSATPSSAPTAARSVRSRRWSPQTGRSRATCGSPAVSSWSIAATRRPAFDPDVGPQPE